MNVRGKLCDKRENLSKDGHQNAGLLCGLDRCICAQIEDARQLRELSMNNELFDGSESRFDGIVALIAAQPTVRFGSGCLVLVMIDDGQQRRTARPCAERQMRILLSEPGGQIG